MAKAPEFDADKVEQLLSILSDLRETVAYQHIREAALLALAAINEELHEELHPEEVAAEKARLEAIQKEQEAA
jgi:hypothetical protein